MLRNQPQLITYVDRLATDLVGLDGVLRSEFADAFGGVHLLPFFTPIDGADAGFDPSDHTEVDARLGDWADVAHIGADFAIVADLIVNHVSSDSPQFRDWQEHGSESAYDGMFLTLDSVFRDGASDDDLARLYRPCPTSPFTTYEIAGAERQVWTTFTSKQVDINVETHAGWGYLISVLDRLAEGGVDLVRLDAVGYAIKKPGTSSFMIPETFEFIERITDACRERSMGVLVEIHSHYRQQIEIASRVDRVYDFALPPLVLHGLLVGDARPLRRWLAIAPQNCVTVLDTHDGIGIVDVAPEGEIAGLLEPSELDQLVEAIHAATDGRSREATGAAASNLDLYQINSTFYEAVGSDEEAHFLARLIQVLCPGIPQVYYAGLLAAPNQMELLSQTGVGRDINRPYFERADLADALGRDVVKDMLGLLRWRSSLHELFDGEFELLDCESHELALRWSSPKQVLDARLDLAARSFELNLDGAILTTPADF